MIPCRVLNGSAFVLVATRGIGNILQRGSYELEGLGARLSRRGIQRCEPGRCRQRGNGSTIHFNLLDRFVDGRVSGGLTITRPRAKSYLSTEWKSLGSY